MLIQTKAAYFSATLTLRKGLQALAFTLTVKPTRWTVARSFVAVLSSTGCGVVSDRGPILWIGRP